jgi:hypothetical protein
VREDPRFGPEPFARIGQATCDLRLRSLCRGYLEFDTLGLDQATFNVVRKNEGGWNIESLLQRRGIAPSEVSSAERPIAERLSLEISRARLNFKIGANKKPFALTDLSARIDLDPANQVVRYEVTGTPVRADSTLPTPGALELTGEWRPGDKPGGTLEALLQTRRALLYDWIPLVTGHNPGVYGVVDATMRLTGSAQMPRLEGEAHVEQLHRWDSLPPSADMPVAIRFRGRWDRPADRLLLDSLDASFANSEVHLTGAVNQIVASPQLDVVISVGRSRAEDQLSLVDRLLGRNPGKVGLSGRMAALVSIRGSWRDPRYFGSIRIREGSVKSPAGTFPLAPVTINLVGTGAELEPSKIQVARHVDLIATGTLHFPIARDETTTSLSRPVAAPSRLHRDSLLSQRRVDLPGNGTYILKCSAKSMPLGVALGLLRNFGIQPLQYVDAQGTVNADLEISGQAWPFTAPLVSGQAELAGRLYLPGFAESLGIRKARLQVSGRRIVIDPLVAELPPSTFTGRLEYNGLRQQPWVFAVQADRLNLDQAALWFDAVNPQSPLRLLEFLPGLRLIANRDAAGAQLFASVRAVGSFATPLLSYRRTRLEHFRAVVNISHRNLYISRAVFRLAEGQGQGSAQVDFTSPPPSVRIDAVIKGAQLHVWASNFPPQLRRIRGVADANLRLETRGFSYPALTSALKGQIQAQLKAVDLGGFDPLAAVARVASFGTLQPIKGDVTLPAATATVTVRDRRLIVSCPIFLNGALLDVTGVYGFDGSASLRVRADLTHVKRRWLDDNGYSDPTRIATFRLGGRLDRLGVLPTAQTVAVRR